MNKILIFSMIVSLASLQNIEAQNKIKHSEVFNINPVVINKIDELSSKENCKINVVNKIFNDPSTGILSFNGTEYEEEGQIDAQIAVGGNYVLHLSNVGAMVYDKKGNIKKTINLSCLTKSQDCLDPKVFFDQTNKYFGFGVWDNTNSDEKKPMRLMFSKTDNPLLEWHLYNIPAEDGVDGGSIGYGGNWILYRYDPEKVLITNSLDVRSGNTAKFYKFNTLVGQPVFNQDNGKTYAFYLDSDNKTFTLQTIKENNGVPTIAEVWKVANVSDYTESLPFSKQKGSSKLVSSGDFNPKNVVIQNNSVWFSHIVKNNNNSAIEWVQLSLEDGSLLQQGLISKDGTNYIQPTIAVNSRGDMAIGFQETNKDMYISTRTAYRLVDDENGTTREVINVSEGNSPYFGHPENKDKEVAWGDYSGSIVDGDNGIDFWFAQSYSKDKKVRVKIYRLKL